MRRLLPLLLAAGLVLGGAACGDDDEPAADSTTTTADAAPSAEEPDATTSTTEGEEPSSTTEEPTETTDGPDDPDDPDEGTVPTDPELQDRLPEVDGFERELDDDESFDAETCDGEALPTPESQASADYSDGTTGFTIGAVRFGSSGDAEEFLDAFVASLDGCIEEGEEVERSDLDVGDEGYVLQLTSGDDRAWIYTAKENDDVWLAFAELEEGDVEPGPEVLEAFTQAVEG